MTMIAVYEKHNNFNFMNQLVFCPVACRHFSNSSLRPNTSMLVLNLSNIICINLLTIQKVIQMKIHTLPHLYCVDRFDINRLNQ